MASFEQGSIMCKLHFPSAVLVLLIIFKGARSSLLASTCSKRKGQLPLFGEEESLRDKYTIVETIPEQLVNVELPDLDDVLQKLGILEM